MWQRFDLFFCLTRSCCMLQQQELAYMLDIAQTLSWLSARLPIFDPEQIAQESGTAEPNSGSLNLRILRCIVAGVLLSEVEMRDRAVQQGYKRTVSILFGQLSLIISTPLPNNLNKDTWNGVDRSPMQDPNSLFPYAQQARVNHGDATLRSYFVQDLSTHQKILWVIMLTLLILFNALFTCNDRGKSTVESDDRVLQYRLSFLPQCIKFLSLQLIYLHLTCIEPSDPDFYPSFYSVSFTHRTRSLKALSRFWHSQPRLPKYLPWQLPLSFVFSLHACQG